MKQKDMRRYVFAGTIHLLLGGIVFLYSIKKLFLQGIGVDWLIILLWSLPHAILAISLYKKSVIALTTSVLISMVYAFILILGTSQNSNLPLAGVAFLSFSLLLANYTSAKMKTTGQLTISTNSKKNRMDMYFAVGILIATNFLMQPARSFPVIAQSTIFGLLVSPYTQVILTIFFFFLQKELGKRTKRSISNPELLSVLLSTWVILLFVSSAMYLPQ